MTWLENPPIFNRKFTSSSFMVRIVQPVTGPPTSLLTVTEPTSKDLSFLYLDSFTGRILSMKVHQYLKKKNTKRKQRKQPATKTGCCFKLGRMLVKKQPSSCFPQHKNEVCWMFFSSKIKAHDNWASSKNLITTDRTLYHWKFAKCRKHTEIDMEQLWRRPRRFVNL